MSEVFAAIVGRSRSRHRRTARSRILILAALVGLSSCRGDEPGVQQRQEMPSSPHPVIILDIDTLRADHLGVYGYARETSPNLDAIARESVVFEWAFGPAPNTLPSQTTILSSLHPTAHGVFEESNRISDDVDMLAEVLHRNGLLTAAFLDGGFMSKSFGFSQGFDVFNSRRGGLARSGPLVVDWVRQHAERNFLLLVHTYDVHAPYDPPEPFRSVFTVEVDPPTPGFEPTTEELVRVRLSMFTDEPSPLPQRDLDFAVARYDGGIRYVDDWIGSFFEELERLGLTERATVIVLSDHGEEFQEHGSVGHEKLYATITRIPLMIRFPGGRVKGRVREIVSAVDVMPTVLDLLGMDAAPLAQGRSLVPTILSQESSPHLAFGESNYFGKRRFIAQGDYRLLFTQETGAVELFDFRRDPLELVDLAAAEPERTEKLRQTLVRWRRQLEAAADRPFRESNEPSLELKDQLRALGYVE